MGLTWWPVAVAGFACLAVAVALALLLPMEQARRQLRRLANSSRLTRLPDYTRLARARSLSMLVTIVLLGLLFGSAVVASARPSGWWWSSATADPPQDVMLCVGEPIAEPVTGDFLTYFAGQARTYGTQRIGLTSANRRVVPMTRDYQYVAGKFGDLAELSDEPESDTSDSAASFSPAVSYIDYASSVEDILALCMTGFPSFEDQSSHRRSLIYLGPGQVREPGETATLADDRCAGHRNGERLGRPDQCPRPSDRGAGALPSIAESTGGQFFSFDPRQSALTDDLNAIRDSPPQPSATADADFRRLVRRQPRHSTDHRGGDVDTAVSLAGGAATMTFQPVLPAVVLIVIAVIVVALRLLNMRRLHTTAVRGWSTVWRWSGLTLAVLLILLAAAPARHRARRAGSHRRGTIRREHQHLLHRRPVSRLGRRGLRQTGSRGCPGSVRTSKP